MPINYTIQADVVDISADAPRTADSFLVDSNVWLWMTYSRCTQGDRPPQSYQTSLYPVYVNAALAAPANLLWCGLSLAEISHLIEKTEREIYERTSPAIRPKEFRHNIPAMRANVVREVESAWGSVQSLADPMDAIIDGLTTNAALTRFQTQMVDGYDLFILEGMQANGIVQVITDDGDYATVPGIQVFTANRNVIQAARTQGRLVTR